MNVFKIGIIWKWFWIFSEELARLRLTSSSTDPPVQDNLPYFMPHVVGSTTNTETSTSEEISNPDQSDTLASSSATMLPYFFPEDESTISQTTMLGKNSKSRKTGKAASSRGTLSHFVFSKPTRLRHRHLL